MLKRIWFASPLSTRILKKAALFANELSKAYRDQNAGRAQESADAALESLKVMVSEYEMRKRKADLAIHEFRSEHDLLGINERYNATLQALATVQGDWASANSQRIQMEAKVNELAVRAKSNSWRPLANFLSVEDTVLTSLLKRYEELKQEQSSMAGRYLAEHPESKRLKPRLRIWNVRFGREESRTSSMERPRDWRL